jgi:ATP-dependent DNA helicase RecG
LAGLLALGRYPQEHFPQLMVTFVYYPTAVGANALTGERFLDNVMIEGPIPVMVRDALAAVRRNMSRRSVVKGPGRIDTFEYPETALREAVVNALVHRDLSAPSCGSQVQIEMYPDRLVVRNPGGLFGPVTVESLGEEGVSSSRNATLLKLLEEVPVPGTQRAVCENRGSGIKIMIDALRRARMSPPRFDDRIASFSVTFPNHTLLNDDVVAWITSMGEHSLTDNQCLALALLKNGELLDNRSYRSATGVDSRIATQELGDLVARELVEQTGSRRWARYRLADDVADSGQEEVGAQRRRADRRAELLAVIGDGSSSRAELVERTGLASPTVSRWLRVMRNEGVIEPTEALTKSPNVRYRRTGLTALDEHGEG